MKRNRSALIVVLIVVTLIIAAVPMLTVQADYGTNWSGTFFNDTNFRRLNPGSAQTVNGINGLNFNWGTGAPFITPGQPIPGIGADNFSARFTSSQNLTPGQYNFVTSSDDGVRLYVNGALVINKFIGRTDYGYGFAANLLASLRIAVEILRASVAHAKTRNDFVENQEDVVFNGQLAERLQEIRRGRDHSHIAGNRLQDDAGQLTPSLFDDSLDSANIIIGSGERVFSKVRRDAEGIGNAERSEP